MVSKRFKNFMAKLYGFGASVVIIGALFKIQHWQGAGIMLTVGLGTESIIFFFSAFEKPHEDPDWSLVYPELAGLPGGADGGPKLTPTQELDQLLEEAKVGPELIENLGNNLRALGDNVSKMSDITDASIATEEYVGNVKSAAQKVGDLSDVYARAAASVSAIVVDDSGVDLSAEVSKMAGSLTELNSQYAQQLSSTKQFLSTTDGLYSGVSDLMSTLNDSVEDAKRYKNEVSQLAQNITSLNSVVGAIVDEDESGIDVGSEIKRMGSRLAELNSQYELQLEGTKQFLSSSDALYSGMNDLMGSLGDSVDDTRKYKQEVAQLAQNISSLNTVYGNMLSAMNRPQG